MGSSREINQWNAGWRSSPLHRELLGGLGVPTDGPFKLTDQQRKQLQAALEQRMGTRFPKGVEIDPAGNMNENEGFGKQAKKWGPIVGAAALTMFGIPGVMPGLLTAGGGAAGAGAAGAASSAGGGTLASSSLPAASLMNAVPASISSAGVSAGVGAGAAMPLANVITGGTLPGVTGTPVANGTLTGGTKAAASLGKAAGMDPISMGILGGSTLLNYIGARSASNAAKDAAETQAQSAREALGFQREMWNQTQENARPWLDAGRSALGTQTALMGLNVVGSGGAPAPQAPAAALSKQPTPTAVQTGRQAVPRGAALPLSSVAAPPPAAAAAPQARGSSFVNMEYQGSMKAVPEQHVAHYEGLGARRVG